VMLVENPAERDSMERLAVMPEPEQKQSSDTITIMGPGRVYSVEDATAVLQGHLTNRDFARGKAMFTTVGCLVCHRFNGEGIGRGPDLSAVGNRFSMRDLMESIIVPGAVVSDQYENIMPPGLINRLNEEELRDMVAYILSGGNRRDKMFKREQAAAR
jgi:mono/diheme cytochrome c family protein